MLIIIIYIILLYNYIIIKTKQIQRMDKQKNYYYYKLFRFILNYCKNFNKKKKKNINKCIIIKNIH